MKRVEVPPQKEYKYVEPIKVFDYKMPKIKIHHIDNREHKEHSLNVMFNQYNELIKILFRNSKQAKIDNTYIMGLAKALGMNPRKDAFSVKNMASKEHVIKLKE